MSKTGMRKSIAAAAFIVLHAAISSASTGISIEGEYKESYFHDNPAKNSQISGPFELSVMDKFFAIRVLDVEDAYRRESYLVSDLAQTYTARTHVRLEDNGRTTLGDFREGAFPGWNSWYKAQLLYLALLARNRPDAVFDGDSLKNNFTPEIVVKRASILNATVRTEVLRKKSETEIKFWATTDVPASARAKAKEPKNTFLLADLRVSHDPEKQVPSGAHFSFYRYVVSSADGTFKHLLRTEIDFKMEEAREREISLAATYAGKADETVYVTDRRKEFQQAPNFAYGMPSSEAPPYPALNQKRYDYAVKRLQTMRTSAVLKESKRKLTVYALGAFSLMMAGAIFYPRSGDKQNEPHE